MMEIEKDIAGCKDEIVRLRRDFHRFPELGFQEVRTAAKIAEYLAGLGLEVRTGVGKTGVVGLLAGRAPGPTLLLRADMDALPIQEKTDLPFSSQNSGVMHACGHDGHMAILLIVAKLLAGIKDSFAGRVKFVFQPGEEGFAGARAMIQDGALKDPEVDAAFGLHLYGGLPVGCLGLRAGPFMASMDAFTIEILGKAAHAATPEAGVDAIMISAQFLEALQIIANKEKSPLSPLLVHVGTINGGDAFNVIASKVELKGTVRALSEAIRGELPGKIRRLLEGITRGLQGDFNLNYELGYPPVINHDAMTSLVRSTAEGCLGKSKVLEIPPTMISEDMAFILKEVPGCFFFLGCGNEEKGIAQPQHSPFFDIDEDALLIGAGVMREIALNFLSGANARPKNHD